jgi:hypothetical protein
MNKIYLTNGEEIQYEEFQPSNKNLIKVKLHINEENVENIWAVLDDATMQIYNKDTNSDYKYFAVLRNHAIAFYPNPSWGMVIPIKFNGTERPECDINIIDFDKTVENNDDDMIFNKLETLD